MPVRAVNGVSTHQPTVANRLTAKFNAAYRAADGGFLAECEGS
jgi:hypothetical protein